MCIFAAIADSLNLWGIYGPFEPTSLSKINILQKQFVIAAPIKTAHHRISWNFVVKLNTVYVCIFTGKSDLILFLREHRTLAKIYFATCVKLAKHVYINSNDKEAVLICFGHWTSKCHSNVAIINRFCVSDYYRYLIIAVVLIYVIKRNVY